MCIKILMGLGVIYMWYIFWAEDLWYEDKHIWNIIPSAPQDAISQTTKPKQSTLSQHIIDVIKDALRSDHNIAHPSADITYNAQYYQELCHQNLHICQMMYYNGNATWQQKTRWFAMISYNIHRIDQHLNSQVKLSDVISHITINAENMGRRWAAGKSVVEFNMGKIKSNREFMVVISHEFNHVVDLGVLEGILSKLDTNYTEFGKPQFTIDDPSIDFYKLSRNNEKTLKPWIGYKDFVSGYSLTDPFEDFSETANLYLYYHDTFYKMIWSSEILSKKYAYMQQLYKSKLISKGPQIVKIQADNTWRPWDTTKVSIE